MSTALYDTAPHLAAPRETPPERPQQHSGRHRERPGSTPGDFAPRIYRGRSVDELIPKIVSELGEDAVVIRHHRGLAGGFAGFFQRPFVEIEARRGAPGIDLYDEDDAAPVLPDEAALAPADDTAPALHGELEHSQAQVSPTPEGWEEPMQVWATNPFAAALAEAEAAVRAAEPSVPPDLDAALAEALAEAEDAEAPIEDVAPLPPNPLYAEPPEEPAESEDVELPAEHVAAALPAEAPDPQPPATAPPARERAHDGREEIERTLLAVGMGEEFVHELIEGTIAHVLPLVPAYTNLQQAVRTALVQRIPASPPLPAGGAAIAVVGAGGSGKSACCSALAEAYGEHSTLPATRITIAPEPTRPAGVKGKMVADLRSLNARILGPLPLTDPHAAAALREAREGGLLLLDTPPVSCADPGSIAALAELLAELAPDRVVLALPATLGATPAAQLLQALRPLNANALAVTHADETDQLGVAVQAACTLGPAPVYLLARAGQSCADGGLRAWSLTSVDPCQLVDGLLPPR